MLVTASVVFIAAATFTQHLQHGSPFLDVAHVFLVWDMALACLMLTYGGETLASLGGNLLTSCGVFAAVTSVGCYLERNKTMAAPDFLHLGAPAFLRHFLNIVLAKAFPPTEDEVELELESATRLIGYSCRTLFHAYMRMHSEANPDIKVATTAIHHTSFRNIIEQHVKPENIHILPMDDAFSKLEAPPCDVDLVVVTHLFGRDFDMSAIAEAKRTMGFEFAEDRCQGGTLSKGSFSCPDVDISFYSMGMDKRPIALGGGFVDYRAGACEASRKAHAAVLRSLRQESSFTRLVKLSMKLPTWFLYNSQSVISILFMLLDLANLCGIAFSVNGFQAKYRSKNPGFEHDHYMCRPSAGMHRSILEQFGDWKVIEATAARKNAVLTAALGSELTKAYIPWYREETTTSVYTTMVVDAGILEQMDDFMEKRRTIVCHNPTYKILEGAQGGEYSALDPKGVRGGTPRRCAKREAKFFKGMVYLPCLFGLSDAQIRALAGKLAEFAETEVTDGGRLLGPSIFD